MTALDSEAVVIIPVHNGLEYTKRCLAALDAQDESHFEIVVVDDGSSDGTADWLHRERPDVTVLTGSGDLWWSGAINLGGRYATKQGARVLVFYNNDNVLASPNLIHRLAARAETAQACVSAVALVEAPNGTRTILHAGGKLDWCNWSRALVESGASYVPEERLVECDWLPGTALAIPAEAFSAVGGADRRRFPQYRGDIDLTLRARAVGYRCLVARNAWVVNDKGQSGLRFDHRLSVREIVRGLVSLRSPYNVGEAIPFALRHCPRRLLPRYLALYYARYIYASLKTRYPHIVRLRSIFNASSAGESV